MQVVNCMWSFGKLEKGSLGFRLVLAWLLHSKATQWDILLGKPRKNPKYERTKRLLQVINPKSLAHLTRWLTRRIRTSESWCFCVRFLRSKNISKVRRIILSTKLKCLLRNIFFKTWGSAKFMQIGATQRFKHAESTSRFRICKKFVRFYVIHKEEKNCRELFRLTVNTIFSLDLLGNFP